MYLKLARLAGHVHQIFKMSCKGRQLNLIKCSAKNTNVRWRSKAFLHTGLPLPFSKCIGSLQLTFPFAWGIPSDVYLTPPSKAAKAKLYPDIASGEDLRWCILFMHRSMRMVICDGNATAMLLKHQAAESLAAGVGWIRTDTTGSIIPEITLT